MTIRTKTALKALFEKGDRPAEQDFIDWLDTCVVIPATAATGFIEVESAASGTSRPVGAFGIQMLATEATASGAGLLALPFVTAAASAGALGIILVSANTTSAALDQLGGGTVGKEVLAAAATASAQQHIGGGTVGRTIFEAITTAAADAITDVVGGQIAQVVNTQTGAVATGTTVMVLDDTIPQNTEGDEYMTLAITPGNTANLLIIDVTAQLAVSSAPNNMMMALFQDSTADALAAVRESSGQTNKGKTLVLRHFMTAGTTSSTTFRMRAGGTGGTVSFNGESGARILGGVLASSITITEIAA